jgi:uncharacterized protein
MMIIDVHTHIFPDHVAEQAVEFMAKEAGVPYFSNGKKCGLLASMHEAGVTQSWLQPVATKPQQVPSINAMMKEIQAEDADALVSFGAIHPQCDDLPAIIHDLAQSGIPGIKIHPEYQRIQPENELFYPMYEAIIEENMIILYHAGIDIGIPTLNSTPRQFAALAERFPGLTLILAHMGGFQQWEEVSNDLAGIDVYLDCSYIVGLDDDAFVSLVRKHGVDKILFGTDSPWSSQKESINHINTLPFSEDEKRKILGDNARQLLDSALT